jgi:hypothetical protein
VEVGAALNVIPLPGFTENIQRYVLKKWIFWMQMVLRSCHQVIQFNKMAKRRKTVGYSDADSGLECKVSIKMVV